ncbi:hypothetical protein MHK_006551 [Candidatus Magnetomorum sp. HK-1]|nr:hypothetical protein MHK_006551 [Candidatus Magnetomorum sp. HK-1]
MNSITDTMGSFWQLFDRTSEKVTTENEIRNFLELFVRTTKGELRILPDFGTERPETNGIEVSTEKLCNYLKKIFGQFFNVHGYYIKYEEMDKSIRYELFGERKKNQPWIKIYNKYNYFVIYWNGERDNWETYP